MHGQRTGRRRDARLLALTVALLALGLFGCGESTGEKAFDGSGDDGPALQKVGVEIRDFSTAYTELVSAMTDEDIPTCRDAVESMFDSMQAARDKTLDIESTDLRKTMQEYIGTMHRVALASDRIIAYYEDDTAPADPVLENDLVADFEDAVLASKEADDNLLNRFMEHASPEQREALRDAYRNLQQDFQEQVGE